jgi:hypothetical protein
LKETPGRKFALNLALERERGKSMRTQTQLLFNRTREVIALALVYLVTTISLALAVNMPSAQEHAAASLTIQTTVPVINGELISSPRPTANNYWTMTEQTQTYMNIASNPAISSMSAAAKRSASRK